MNEAIAGLVVAVAVGLALFVRAGVRVIVAMLQVREAAELAKLERMRARRGFHSSAALDLDDVITSARRRRGKPPTLSERIFGASERPRRRDRERADPRDTDPDDVDEPPGLGRGEN